MQIKPRVPTKLRSTALTAGARPSRLRNSHLGTEEEDLLLLAARLLAQYCVWRSVIRRASYVLWCSSPPCDAKKEGAFPAGMPVSPLRGARVGGAREGVHVARAAVDEREG